MNGAYFITGTDTNVGKTWATVALMQYLKQQGKTVLGMKPVASGCEWQDGQLKNDDALLLQHYSSVPIAYELINPYAYPEPISPHLAGAENPVNLDTVNNAFRRLQTLADRVLVEGAGGWYAPINDQQTICDMAKHLALPVIMVVAIRLGCINHARLTYQAIVASGLPCAGWIAVCNDAAMLKRDETIATLEQTLNTPLLAILPYQSPADFDVLAGCVRLFPDYPTLCGSGLNR